MINSQYFLTHLSAHRLGDVKGIPGLVAIDTEEIGSRNESRAESECVSSPRWRGPDEYRKAAATLPRKSIIYRGDVSDYYDPAEPVAADLPLSSGGRVGTVA